MFQCKNFRSQKIFLSKWPIYIKIKPSTKHRRWIYTTKKKINFRLNSVLISYWFFYKHIPSIIIRKNMNQKTVHRRENVLHTVYNTLHINHFITKTRLSAVYIALPCRRRVEYYTHRIYDVNIILGDFVLCLFEYKNGLTLVYNTHSRYAVLVRFSIQ